jgi:hypothetical protein
MKAIGYVRVSTDKQADSGVSLDAQAEKVRAMAVVQGAELTEVIVDAGERGAADLRTKLEAAVRQKRDRLDRVDEAFLHERSIDRATYERQRDQLREQLTLAEMELSDAVVEHLDVEGIIGFAEHVVANAAKLWTEVGLDQKQQLQQTFFPEGLRFDGREFGTVVTCLAFRSFGEVGEVKSGMASPTGFEPVFWP